MLQCGMGKYQDRVEGVKEKWCSAPKTLDIAVNPRISKVRRVVWCNGVIRTKWTADPWSDRVLSGLEVMLRRVPNLRNASEIDLNANSPVP
jgi:hypothetical protein